VPFVNIAAWHLRHIQVPKCSEGHARNSKNVLKMRQKRLGRLEIHGLYEGCCLNPIVHIIIHAAISSLSNSQLNAACLRTSVVGLQQRALSAAACEYRKRESSATVKSIAVEFHGNKHLRNASTPSVANVGIACLGPFRCFRELHQKPNLREFVAVTHRTSTVNLPTYKSQILRPLTMPIILITWFAYLSYFTMLR